MTAALAVGTWSVYTLLTTLLGAPWYVATFGCFMFDGAAFFFARLSQRYATTTDSGLAPRAAMLAMISTSSWVNWRHARLENWGTVGGVILAAAPVIAELAFEMWHRFEHREALRRLGRVAQTLPALGYRTWTTHPFRSRKVIDSHIVAAIIEHQAIAARRVEIADARARSIITLPPGSVETVAIETETSPARSRLVGETETRETETGPAQSHGRPETTATETIAKTGLTAQAETHGTETSLDETTCRDLTWRETETASLTPAGTEETAAPTTETRETETPKVSRPRPPKAETTTVSPIGDRNPETEIKHLLGLMRDRGSETAVSLDDAITETGRPRSTAAKRLKTARDQYRKTAA
jgi:hypothetical protein